MHSSHNALHFCRRLSLSRSLRKASIGGYYDFSYDLADSGFQHEPLKAPSFRREVGSEMRIEKPCVFNISFVILVTEWIKIHRKPVEGKSDCKRNCCQQSDLTFCNELVQHRAIQCSFKEVKQDPFASIENTQLKKRHSVSPYHKHRIKKIFQSVGCYFNT